MIARSLLLLTLAFLALGAEPSPSASTPPQRPGPRLVKVLPHYLDANGRHTLGPSLFDRDAYQYQLRQDATLRTALRFDVQCRIPPGAERDLTLRVELRGSGAPRPSPILVEAPLNPRQSYAPWTRLLLSQEQFAALGDLMAWKITLLDPQGNPLASQQSFLW
jgi:hypothetical protein